MRENVNYILFGYPCLCLVEIIRQIEKKLKKWRLFFYTNFSVIIIVKQIKLKNTGALPFVVKTN